MPAQKKRTTILIVVATLTATSFTYIFGAETHSQETSPSLAGTSWQLVTFRGSDDKSLTPDVRSKYTIAFSSDGRASVRLDCNRGGGTYESTRPNQLQFGRFTLTLKLCTGSFYNRVARDLMKVRTYVIKDGHLFLSLMADGGIYEFEPLGSPASSTDTSLFGRKWRLIEIRGAAVTTNTPYIELVSETNRFSGDGGCNRISGNFDINGETLKFSQVISTRRACLDPAMQQIETDFLKALEEIFIYKLEGDTLRLYAGDRLLLTFKSDEVKPDGSEEGQVSGTITYLQRRALPPNATIEVKLLDVSRAGAPSVTVAEHIITSGGKQVPFAFQLHYNPARINDRGRYVVRARILVGGKLLFTSTDAYPVITGGHGNTVDVIVKPAR